MKNLRLIGLAIISVFQLSSVLGIGREEYPNIVDKYMAQIRQHLSPKGLPEIVSGYIDFQSILDANYQAFKLAIEKGNLAEAKKVIEEGIRVNQINEEGDTPLILIIKVDRSESDKFPILYSLIEQGANVNARDRQGRSALIIALDRELGRIASLLIEKRADVNAIDRQGRNALIVAIDRKLYDIASFLISRSTNLNVQNSEGQTALILAAKQGKSDLVEKLVTYGANSEVKDKHGKTARDYAESLKDQYSASREGEVLAENYARINYLLAPRVNVKKEEGKRSASSLSSASSKEMEENIRIARARAAQEERQRQEEERARAQRVQEAMAAAAARPEEEEWAEESAPAEEAEDGWGNIEQED